MSHTDNAIIDSMNEIKEQAMDEMTAEQMEDHAFDVWCQQNEKIIHQKAFERAFEAALEEWYGEDRAFEVAEENIEDQRENASIHMYEIHWWNDLSLQSK